MKQKLSKGRLLQNILINLSLLNSCFMKKIYSLALILMLLTVSFNVIAQRGKNGAKVITATNTIVNEYTVLTADVNAGSNSINVISNTLNANNRFGTGNVLSPGDLIFIVQNEGASITSCCDQYWTYYGFIESYGKAGLYEFAEVVSVTGNTIINLRCGLINSYGTTEKAQVIRVPRYNSLTVNSGAELTCDTWDGTKGGVLVVETTGNVDIEGTVNATGKGFRGGIVSPTASNVDVGIFYSTSYLNGAQKGEGIAGYGVAADGIYGKGAPANGGGGGNAHNAGGGGGSNTSTYFTWNGAGFPDTTTNATYKQAWDLETTTTVPTGVPFHKNASYGGGRGGYTFSSNDADALTVAPTNLAWGGDYRRVNGGLGGWPLWSAADGFPRLFMGGGGGAGSQNDGFGGAGGNGGGIIYMMTYGTISGVGTVTSNGAAGGNSSGTPTLSKPHAGVDGCGGGGGGGAIVLNTTGNITGISSIANGGSGGNQIKTRFLVASSNEEAEGPGGGGGGGYIAVSNGSITRTTNGGANGTSTAVSPETIGVSEFPPNGATQGGKGVNNDIITNYDIIAPNVNACLGQQATLTATITGTLPAGASYGWYSTEYGTTPLSTSLTLTINNPLATTTYYFGLCPGTFRLAVTLTISPFFPDAGVNQSICSGTSVTLNASGGTSYSWSPATGLSSTTIQNPVCNVTTTTVYTVHITNADGCQANDTVRVTVGTSSNATITPHAPMCINASPVILTAAQNGGTWTGPGITNPATGAFSPAIAGIGNIQIIYTIAGSCGDADTTHIMVNQIPTVNLGHDTTFCQGGNLLLNAGNPGSTYLWSPGGTTSQTLNVTSSGQYIVQVTNAATCSKRDTINVTVNTNANATITPHTPLCVNAGAVTLTAAQTGGVWSGPGIINPATGVFNPATSGIGNIQIIYTIAGSCGDADTTHITVNPLPVVNLGHDTTFCQGGNLLLNAGNPGSSYMWTPGGTTSQTLNVTSSGQYIVQVTNGATCSKRDTINVTVNTNSNATITPHAPLCINAAPVTLTAAQNGGVWSGTGITNPVTGVFNPTVSGIGNIQIIYTIAGSCGDADTTHIMVNPLPVVNLGHDTTFCQGGNLLLNAGNPGSTYLWTPGGATSQTLNVASSGQYIVQVTSAATCSKSDTINVNVTTNANATINTQTPLCINSSPVTLTAAQSGGVWSGPGITNTSTGLFNPSVAGTGNIQIIYTISGLCSDADTTHITVNPLPVVNLGHDTTFCQGGNLLLNAGNPGSTYLWSPGGTTSQTLYVSSSGQYIVQVTNAATCSKRDTINVTVTTNANATIIPHTPLCVNASPVTLTAAQTGGVWSGTGITNPATGVFNPAVSGIGNIQIIYTIPGLCGDADTTHITVNPLPVVNLGHDTTFCQGGNLLLNAGNPGSTYLWTPGSTTSQTLNVTSSGQYIVQVTSAATCVKRDTINVTVNTNANATITPHAPLCANAAAVTLTAAQTGGVWSGPGITNPATGVFNPSVSGTGNIQIIYTISGLCGDADTTHITVNPLPVVDLGQDTTFCQGGNLILDAGNQGSTYMWNNSTTNQTINVNTSGTYWVEVTNTYLCSKRDSIIVNVLPYADATINHVSPVCSNIVPFVMTAAQSGGTWSGTGITNGTTGVFSPAIAGSGVVIITYSIAGTCGNSDTAQVTVLPAPVVTTDTVNPSCPDYNNGSIILHTTGGTPPFIYSWNNASDSSGITHLTNGTYSVTVNDQNNCKEVESVTFDVILVDCFVPVIYVPNIFSPNGDGQNDKVYVHGRGIKSLDFVIYDRWGEKVFETSDNTIPWDGTFKGKDMPVDVYAYHLKATLDNDVNIDKKGNISLVR
jgi:gliding motility-associated-like protein